MHNNEHTLSGGSRDWSQVADDNRARLEEAGTFGVNLMAAPGAGKTTLIQRTVEALSSKLRIGIVEPIVAVDNLVATTSYGFDIPRATVDTAGAPQLDAIMLGNALRRLPLREIELLLVENVGTLVCSGPCQLGLQANVLVASVPEGDDKPYRYTNIYRRADAVVLNKIDLLSWVSFDSAFFQRGVELLKPGIPVLPLSCYTGADLYRWIDWLTLARRDAQVVTAVRSGR